MREFVISNWMLALGCMASLVSAEEVDFNRDIRPILSNKCLLCHGPDPDALESGLRLDLRESAISKLESELTAIVPGDPAKSELLVRVMTDDEDFRMPPAEHGARLSTEEVELLRRWVEQGAPYATHWSYVPPRRPNIPVVDPVQSDWARSGIDPFVLHRMKEHGLSPSPEADRYALARRVFLDLTGLPPTIEEVDQFVASADPFAYEKLVDDLLGRPAYGEHWARKWLDLARYADSAGYADDPPRTIWAYRDWVIDAYNQNMPFDQFTREQLAGDLLASPTESQLIATAFHRNTLTNNEGGTQDEEFRNVAVVDRVNTTMAVWMGTTMACAQCHTHKYDPITQEEYFQFFDILNNTEDADRRDESPLLRIYTEQQRARQKELKSQIVDFQSLLGRATPELVAAQQQWEQRLSVAPDWQALVPAAITRRSQLPAQIQEDGKILVTAIAKQDEYQIEIPVEASPEHVVQWSGFRLEAIPHAALGNHSGANGGNFVVTGIQADLVPETKRSPAAQFVRITNLGKNQILSLAEVQVFRGDVNVALQGTATQHSTAYGGPAQYAIDGNTDGVFANKSVTHTATVENPWWELDLGGQQSVDKIVLWNRKEASARLSNFTVELLDADRQPVMTRHIDAHPDPSLALSADSKRSIAFKTAFADFEQVDFEAIDVLAGKNGPKDGWAIGGSTHLLHQLVLIPEQPLVVDEPARLRIRLQQDSPHINHLLGHFRFSATADSVAIERSRVPAEILKLVDTPADQRSPEANSELAIHYREQVAPALQVEREGLAKAKAELAALKPATSVPVLREKTGQPRETFLQHRGNYLDKGQPVKAGLPSVFPQPSGDRPLDRLVLAGWLTSAENPLTARVLANRYWEILFGQGIVTTSEEFGSQGEMPTHPQLLDWLAVELVDSGWDTKQLLRTLVTSATYRQSAVADAGKLAQDPANRWLARAPRVRLSAEMVRDQALSVSGLLSRKMFGPPVKPPQPSFQLKAAFGSSTDWQTSVGEDRYRRGIYTTWRRSNPYPSMATFDAPNREVCTVRRNSTNTPLQSLVTLNDPAYVEAAQSLARQALQHSSSDGERLVFAFRRCLLRPPTDNEITALTALLKDSREDLARHREEALKLATDPLGALPENVDAVDAAAMTVVCNVLLNLDEIFLKR